MDIDKYNEAHASAMEAVHKAAGIQIHGRTYKPVAARVEAFRRAFGVHGRLRIADFTETEFAFKETTHKRLQMRAVVELRWGDTWQEVAEGHAEEVRGAGGVNVASAAENCETSAYGRALANFGLLGGEYASADEMDFESTVAAKVAEIRGWFAMDLPEDRKAQALAELWTGLSQEHQLSIHERLKLKIDGHDFNERQALKDYLTMAKTAKQKVLANGRAA
jgi:hypothetical protein